MIWMKTETMTKQRKSPIIISQYVPLFPAKTNACALLDKFVPQEKPGKECKPVQKRISGLAAIDLAFHKAMELNETYYERASTSVSLFYDESLAMAGQICYKPKDIESFSKNLAQYHEQYGNYDEFAGKVGEFISALVNASNSWKFRIVTAGLPFKISSLGAETRKCITVHGDLVGITLE